jgi:hypothetical protein
MQCSFSGITVVALAVSALFLPATTRAQAAAASPDCFAQPRARQDTARAVAGGPGRDTSRATNAPLGGADIVLIASVSARELRFESQPKVSVRLCGGLDSVRVVERRNLPERVVPGVTYRDVYVAVEILGHLYADCLREAVSGARSTACPTSADSARTPRRPR